MKKEGKPNMKRNRFTFGIGTIGRDMLYTLYSMYFIFFLTSVINVSTTDLAWITGILVVLRVFDAMINPVMGLIVDNTRTRFGRFKPWMALGAISAGIFAVILFLGPNMSGAPFIILIAVSLFLFAVTYTINDISYWSMLPSLSKDPKERENIGSKARIFALCGTFFVVAGIVPITTMLGGSENSPRGFFLFAILVVIIMWVGQLVTIFGVKEPKEVERPKEKLAIKQMFQDMYHAIFKNDQLLIVAISMALFMIGYTTTVSFGIFYFESVFGNMNMYSIFAIILGISQITSLLMFTVISKRLKRKTLYFYATILVVVGYIIFFFAPTTTMLFIGIAGVLIFIGQAAIQLLMLLYLADTVEYGHWKLRKRNDSVTFSLQPFIFQIGGAVASGIVGFTVIKSGIHQNAAGTLLHGEGLLIFKIAMFIIPLLCILAGFILCHFKYKLDEEKYAEIIQDLKERGDIL